MGCRVSKQKAKEAKDIKQNNKNKPVEELSDRTGEDADVVSIRNKSEKSSKNGGKPQSGSKSGEQSKKSTEKRSKEKLRLEARSKSVESKKIVPPPLDERIEEEKPVIILVEEPPEVYVPAPSPLPPIDMNVVAIQEHQKHDALLRQQQKKNHHRRQKMRQKQHDDEDDTLYEVPSEMPTIDLMQEFYENHRNKNVMTRDSTKT